MIDFKCFVVDDTTNSKAMEFGSKVCEEGNRLKGYYTDGC